MLTDDSTNPRMMPTRENIVRCLHPSFVYCLILFLSSCKQCNGLCAVLRPMMLYFSTVKAASCVTCISSHCQSFQTRGTVVRPKISTEMKLMVSTKVIYYNDRFPQSDINDVL